MSLIIVEYLLKEKDLDLQQNLNKTYYLYTIGSIIGWGYQDAVIWGSGLLNSRNVLRCLRQKLDIRAVRGPRTKELLSRYGICCPEVYGDPACLLPLYYWPSTKKKWNYSLILHHNSELRKKEHIDQFIEKMDIHYIEIMTTNYKKIVEEILQSEIVISSALHGIILAESYGIPTIFCRENLNQDIKFDDWFFATQRFDYDYITNLEDVLSWKTNEVPDISDMQRKLIESFPYDLWQKNL